MAPLLEVSDLRMEFPIRGSRDAVHAVNGVSFAVERGETLGLVGESGSGKTTVGRLIVNLLRPTAGRIVFLDRELATLSSKRFRQLRPRLQMVFQDPQESLNPRMRVRDIIRGPMQNEQRLSAREQQERVRELTGLVRLEPHHLEAYPHQLSGGQQQRVGVARALSTDPDLIVLDEPISNLDPTVRADILELLIRIQRQTSVAYIFISHDLSTVEAVSQRVAIMYLGEIVETGPTDAIFAVQKHPYSRALLSSVLYPDPNVVAPRFPLEGEIPSPIHLPAGCFLASRCPLATAECVAVHPVLEPHGLDRQVACFHTDELARLDLGGSNAAKPGGEEMVTARHEKQ